MRLLTTIRRVPGEQTLVLQCRRCGLSTTETVDAPQTTRERALTLRHLGRPRRTSGAEDRPPEPPCEPFQRDAPEMRIARRVEARRPHGNRGLAGCDG